MGPIKRYEILLPLRYNDGRFIEAEKFKQSKLELIERFGGLTVEPTPALGYWHAKGRLYEDVMIRFHVDAEDTPEVREFFVAYKEVLKERFAQLEIWITAYSLDII